MGTEAAVRQGGLFIPLIDFSKFLHGSADERADVSAAILHGFQTAGFVYLRKHSVPLSSARDIFARSADFFARPIDEKTALSVVDTRSNRGYLRQGREKLVVLRRLAEDDAVAASNGAARGDDDDGDGDGDGDGGEIDDDDDVSDLKESFEIGREPHQVYGNRWPAPDLVPGFRDTAMRFFEECHVLHVQVMRAIATGLGLDEVHFDGFVDAMDNTLRLLHYPQVEAKVFKAKAGQVRAGAHTDYGSLTLLFQDDSGGLQVKAPSGEFVDATPIPDTIVVNAGDLLARWSNDTIKSTVHRVVEPPRDEAVHPARYSVAYFANPNFDALIETIPGTYAAEADKKYAGINSGEYLERRLAATIYGRDEEYK